MAYSRQHVERLEVMLEEYLIGIQEDYEERKEKFIESVKNSPTSAIQWDSESLVGAEYLNREINTISANVEKVGLVGAVKHTVSLLKDRARYFRMSSSSLYSNANEHSQHVAVSRFLERVEGYLARIDWAIEEAYEEANLQQGATDVTEYALRETKTQLLSQLETYENAAKNSKTKKGEVANHRAATAVHESIANLESLAKTLGINIG